MNEFYSAEKMMYTYKGKYLGFKFKCKHLCYSVSPSLDNYTTARLLEASRRNLEVRKMTVD